MEEMSLSQLEGSELASAGHLYMFSTENQVQWFREHSIRCVHSFDSMIVLPYSGIVGFYDEYGNSIILDHVCGIQRHSEHSVLGEVFDVGSILTLSSYPFE